MEFSKLIKKNMGDCPERWVDVFVTKQADDPVSDQKYMFDDTFCCSVQSIEFHPEYNLTAYITERDSPWILPTWKHYDLSDEASNPYADIKVGDLVRVGGVHTDGFTDYLTVVELHEVSFLFNACSTAVKINKDTSENVSGTDSLAASTTSTTLDNAEKHTMSKAGIFHKAIRLNANINATKLPSYIPLVENSITDTSYLRQSAYKAADQTSAFCDLSTRDHAYEYVNSNSEDEKYFYPLYKAKNWVSGTVLNARLDHGVKQVTAIKLLGYSLVNKRSVGIQHAHEMQSDDYLILRIREIEGHVISNNAYAHGAFAVLRAGDSSHQIQGATEFSAYEPTGIVCVPIRQTNTTMRNLTIEVTDRLGRPAHFGRFHLWFKLLVTHG